MVHAGDNLQRALVDLLESVAADLVVEVNRHVLNLATAALVVGDASGHAEPAPSLVRPRAAGSSAAVGRRQKWTQASLVEELAKLRAQGTELTASVLQRAGRTDLVMAVYRHLKSMRIARHLVAERGLSAAISPASGAARGHREAHVAPTA